MRKERKNSSGTLMIRGLREIVSGRDALTYAQQEHSEKTCRVDNATQLRTTNVPIYSLAIKTRTCHRMAVQDGNAVGASTRTRAIVVFTSLEL